VVGDVRDNFVVGAVDRIHHCYYHLWLGFLALPKLRCDCCLCTDLVATHDEVGSNGLGCSVARFLFEESLPRTPSCLTVNPPIHSTMLLVMI
jgi:hypothetical protein